MLWTGRFYSCQQDLTRTERAATMKRLIDWFSRKIAPKKADPPPDFRRTGTHLRQTGSHAKPVPPKPAAPKPQPEFVELDTHVDGHIEDNGPGKNVLIRNRYVREDTGTHETLKILDDSMLDTQEEQGFDPYNTGQFDRSKNWDKRRK